MQNLKLDPTEVSFKGQQDAGGFEDLGFCIVLRVFSLMQFLFPGKISHSKNRKAIMGKGNPIFSLWCSLFLRDSKTYYGSW